MTGLNHTLPMAVAGCLFLLQLIEEALSAAGSRGKVLVRTATNPLSRGSSKRLTHHHSTMRRELAFSISSFIVPSIVSH